MKQLQGLAIECPLCLTITTTPQKGIDHLPKAFNVLGILEGSKMYERCKSCIKTTYPPNSATLHCIDCQDVYCGACSDKVHLKVENQDHILRLANSFDDKRLSRSSERLKNERYEICSNDGSNGEKQVLRTNSRGMYIYYLLHRYF